MKRFLLPQAGLAVPFLVSIGFLSSCVVHAGSSMRFGTTLLQTSRMEEHPIDVASGGRLEVDLPSGDVHVRSSAGARGSVKATITALAQTAEEATAWLAETEVRIEPAKDGVRITFVDPRREQKKYGGSRATVDLEILVPEEVHLDLRSNSGDILAEGAFAASTARSSYGDVQVRGVGGDLQATSNSGDIQVADVRGASVVAKTAYGDVEVRRCDVEKVEAGSRSGDVRLQDWKGSRAELETKYGDVLARGAKGDLDAESSSGRVEIDGFEGPLRAKSGYGDVRVEGILTALGAETRSGDVRVRARSGSRIEGTWKIATSYGEAELSVPEELGLELDASTSYGEVKVDAPLQGSSMKSGGKSLQGKVNGGGGLVEIRCRSGDVRVRSGGS